jgi:GNAT superfamily N-acetyltransferase
VSGPPAVRRATQADLPELAAMLTRAFLDDPVTEWAWRPRALRPAGLERFQRIRLRQLIAHEEVWTTADLSCAALWAPPESWRGGLRDEVELASCFLPPRLLARAPLVAIGWNRIERAHPARPPHWYLAVLGTEPDRQGQGLGSLVMDRVLEQCDRDGVAAYLESSKERNIDFYSRHGFRVRERVDLLRGPPMWAMWREPCPR